MQRREAAGRLAAKSTRHAIEMELRDGYDLSPVEAQVLAQRVQELVDRQLGQARQVGQITYQAIAMDEPPGRVLRQVDLPPKRLRGTPVPRSGVSAGAENGGVISALSVPGTRR